MAKLCRIDKPISDAILALMRYIRDTTGIEPSQEEIATALQSYFILNEIGNQIKFQRKKPNAQTPPETSLKGPLWALNLMASSPSNNYVRAGLFYEGIQVAIQTIRDFGKKSSGVAPSETEIASSLKSSFILNDIKNQIEWQRQDARKANKVESKLG